MHSIFLYNIEYNILLNVHGLKYIMKRSYGENKRENFFSREVEIWLWLIISPNGSFEVRTMKYNIESYLTSRFQARLALQYECSLKENAALKYITGILGRIMPSWKENIM